MIVILERARLEHRIRQRTQEMSKPGFAQFQNKILFSTCLHIKPPNVTFFFYCHPIKNFCALHFYFPHHPFLFFLHGTLTYWVCRTINFKKKLAAYLVHNTLQYAWAINKYSLNKYMSSLLLKLPLPR